MDSDEALVANALTSGPEAFAPIVQRYQSAVFGVALARVRDFHEAEDIAQSVFVDAFLQLDRLQDTRRLGPWLRTMAIHKGIDRIRRRREHVDVAEISNDPHHAEMPEAWQEDGRREWVMAAIARLSDAQRETITLHYLGGFSVQEIARMQGVESPVEKEGSLSKDKPKRRKSELPTQTGPRCGSVSAPRED